MSDPLQRQLLGRLGQRVAEAGHVGRHAGGVEQVLPVQALHRLGRDHRRGGLRGCAVFALRGGRRLAVLLPILASLLGAGGLGSALGGSGGAGLSGSVSSGSGLDEAHEVITEFPRCQGAELEPALNQEH